MNALSPPKINSKIESISNQEEVGQSIIERSVEGKAQRGITVAKLPFISDPKVKPNDGMAIKVDQAKGTNNMNRLVEILIRWTKRKQGFHTEIQKMYNSVRLEKTHWCYKCGSLLTP